MERGQPRCPAGPERATAQAEGQRPAEAAQSHSCAHGRPRSRTTETILRRRKGGVCGGLRFWARSWAWGAGCDLFAPVGWRDPDSLRSCAEVPKGRTHVCCVSKAGRPAPPPPSEENRGCGCLLGGRANENTNNKKHNNNSCFCPQDVDAVPGDPKRYLEQLMSDRPR